MGVDYKDFSIAFGKIPLVDYSGRLDHIKAKVSKLIGFKITLNGRCHRVVTGVVFLIGCLHWEGFRVQKLNHHDAAVKVVGETTSCR